jgi:hypothetical protein
VTGSTGIPELDRIFNGGILFIDEMNKMPPATLDHLLKTPGPDPAEQAREAARLACEALATIPEHADLRLPTPTTAPHERRLQ